MKVSEGPVKELGLVTLFTRFQFGGIIPLWYLPFVTWKTCHTNNIHKTHPLGFNRCVRDRNAHYITSVNMTLLFYFITHNKYFIILKLNAWPVPWMYQAKEKTKITRILCLTNKIQNTCYNVIKLWVTCPNTSRMSVQHTRISFSYTIVRGYCFFSHDFINVLSIIAFVLNKKSKQKQPGESVRQAGPAQSSCW